jgi:DNA-3-methyladenine glycosylase II
MEHISHLNKDKKLRKIIALQEPYELKRKKLVYLHLCASIVSQQLSTKVADVIWARFLSLFPTKTPTAEQILLVPLEKLRSVGLSNAKAQYVQNVCRFFMDEKITDQQLNKMSNAEVIQYLTRIKGVGQWTVEMILMFSLGREDVFAADDLGIQQSMAKLYHLEIEDKKALKKQMLQISAKWAPYQTYACRYLWGWKDGK